MKKGSKLLPLMVYLLGFFEVVVFKFIQQYFGISTNNAVFMMIVMSSGMITMATMFLTISWAVKKASWKKFFKVISVIVWVYTFIMPIFIIIYCIHPEIINSFMYSTMK